jgi:hypothetical protein
MPQVNQPAEEKSKLWATVPRKPTRRNPAKTKPKPTTQRKIKSKPSLPNKPPARKSKPLPLISSDAKTGRDTFLQVTAAHRNHTGRAARATDANLSDQSGAATQTQRRRKPPDRGAVLGK